MPPADSLPRVAHGILRSVTGLNQPVVELFIELDDGRLGVLRFLQRAFFDIVARRDARVTGYGVTVDVRGEDPALHFDDEGGLPGEPI